jgi:hypothetical protein
LKEIEKEELCGEEETGDFLSFALCKRKTTLGEEGEY